MRVLGDAALLTVSDQVKSGPSADFSASSQQPSCRGPLPLLSHKWRVYSPKPPQKVAQGSALPPSLLSVLTCNSHRHKLTFGVKDSVVHRLGQPSALSNSRTLSHREPHTREWSPPSSIAPSHWSLWTCLFWRFCLSGPFPSLSTTHV